MQRLNSGSGGEREVWAAGKLAELAARLERGMALLARADELAAALRAARGTGPTETERRLIAAGVDCLTAEEIAQRGWSDPRPALRRDIKRLESRIAGVRRFLERRAA